MFVLLIGKWAKCDSAIAVDSMLQSPIENCKSSKNQRIVLHTGALCTRVGSIYSRSNPSSHIAHSSIAYSSLRTCVYVCVSAFVLRNVGEVFIFSSTWLLQVDVHISRFPIRFVDDVTVFSMLSLSLSVSDSFVFLCVCMLNQSNINIIIHCPYRDPIHNSRIF